MIKKGEKFHLIILREEKKYFGPASLDIRPSEGNNSGPYDILRTEKGKEKEGEQSEHVLSGLKKKTRTSSCAPREQRQSSRKALASRENLCNLSFVVERRGNTHSCRRPPERRALIENPSKEIIVARVGKKEKIDAQPIVKIFNSDQHRRRGEKCAIA